MASLVMNTLSPLLTQRSTRKSKALTTRKSSRVQNSKLRQHALQHGYRSGLEERIAGELEARGIQYVYEREAIPYVTPATNNKYTPDFFLSNGIIVETKGRWLTADRKKHGLVREQHPELDIRIVFSDSRNRISKTSATTYAAYCLKRGWKFADKSIPNAWLLEVQK
jgi:hypothetical protein